MDSECEELRRGASSAPTTSADCGPSKERWSVTQFERRQKRETASPARNASCVVQRQRTECVTNDKSTYDPHLTHACTVRVRAPSSHPPRVERVCSWGRELGRSRTRPRGARDTAHTDPHDPPTHSAYFGLGQAMEHGQALSGSVLSSRLEMLERTKVHT
eukprot:scaffold113651_cov60-Phaeocystis_antarctica.AAC.4